MLNLWHHVDFSPEDGDSMFLPTRWYLPTNPHSFGTQKNKSGIRYCAVFVVKRFSKLDALLNEGRIALSNPLPTY
jgi:hypothetical protein